ncbi:response regulator transcription factor [Pelotomaculum terephthalicicum JT]|uniref:response regulator n=1 Tax=Pelotomaculum TaxID=191373 RepID=UPI0009C9518A|nr:MULTISPECIES: response regulator transcription factor [Pelotomaculum]MCG9966478.1 response regulator transcription factor [Pelotomaculum terephthalicicum JT]OPX85975.1 MAG: Transcriptional regulatory protein DegU [Pelotomaculum sp. PtaB.Bin117]OPY63381.1 MAG: Transcriptional regulatory protein DegU [Pelotomaculum sp. PtaU1.Bin065]
MKRIKVLITDDHTLIREGLRKILSTEEAIEVVGEAEDGQQAIEQAIKIKPDVILMDITMPKVNGIEATRIIKNKYPEIGIIALTIHDQEEYLFELIKAGASGYVLKDIRSDVLVQTIVGVARGESFIPPSMTTKIFAEFSRLSSRHAQDALPQGLTRREVDVLRLVAHGESNRNIAQKLYISEKTVKNHLTNIFQKLGVIDRTQAALLAVKNKIVDL